ncbi:isopentenyl-diphosphate Delta-isomerase [Nonomuraea montanisoli]|uniref:isopentenyl-diphosphate Delta-isomerase n=1 Tax=Nonomuraea montanisoli TaxID=2741721 RepID=UPI002E298F79|nr:isopentenyl-diphosphate Delta-isomerase [Nonomuraea montanisoli]
MHEGTVPEERVVLLDPEGHAIGSAAKLSAHHADTPYHLAFSSYIVNAAGQVLITRRAASKKTFPGVLTNSCCGHPAPGEGLKDAVARRVRTELGITLREVSVILPRFSYRAVAGDGTVEHELCPVVRATASDERLSLNLDEVSMAAWLSWEECRELTGHSESSPWFRLQMEQLECLGRPSQWPEAPESSLPPALAHPSGLVR